MLSYIWNTFLYQPLINALAFLVSVVPGGDVGVAIILLTILVKILLFPLSQHQLRNQAAMAILAPELEKIKKSGASQEEQARLTFELYRKHKTNPFSGCLAIIPTIFVLIALYQVFIKGINFENEVLYSFITRPEHANMLFLGLIDISQKSFILALLAAISQYFQAHFMPKPVIPKDAPADSFQVNFSKSMYTNMKYGFPIFIFLILYTNILGISLSGAVALYFIVSNLFAIGQQIYIKKTERKVLNEEAAELATK
jgi:YidC/Oxa1 family membrane protein insertase